MAEVVTAYCKRAGALPPSPRDGGVYVLHFDNKFEVEFWPGGRDRLLLRSNLPPLKRDRNRPDMLRRLLRANLVLSGRKRSTLTLDNASDTPFLYDTLTVAAADVAPSFRSITGFVNEVAAFHKVLESFR